MGLFFPLNNAVRLFALLGVLLVPWPQAASPLHATPHAISALTPPAPAAAVAQELALLTDGHPVVRELAGGATHFLQVALAEGQYLRVLVDQRGIDIKVAIFAPDGQKLVEMDSPNSTQGPEAAALIAAQRGNYRIEIASLNKEVPRATYEARVAALRTATEQDRQWIAAQSYYTEGQALRQQGTTESRRKSIESYQRALHDWRALGERLMEAHTLYCIGFAWRALNQPQKALEVFEEALRLQQPEDGWREEANARYLIGLAQGDLGEPRQALTQFEQALILQRAMGDVYAEAMSLLFVGESYRVIGEAHKALEYTKPALAVWQKLGNRGREATVLHNIGRAYETLGEHQSALEYFFQALQLQRSLQNRSEEALELNSIGYTHSLLGEWKKALEYYNQALALWRAAADQRREAIVLSNIGFAHAALNEQVKAAESYQQALKLQRAVNDPLAEAVTLEGLGYLYAASAAPQQALAQYERSLQLRRNTGDRLGEAATLSSRGQVYAALNQTEQAQGDFKESLQLYGANGNRRGRARAHYGLALVARARGQLDKARRQIEAALLLVEQVRADAGSQQLRASYLASVRKYYELNIDLLMQLDQARPAVRPSESFAALALNASERARARSLLELLTEARADIRQGVDPALLARERELAQRLNAKAERQQELTGRRNEAQGAALAREISELEVEYQQVQAAIRRNSPHYAALTQPEPLKLADIQAQLDDNTLLLEYALGEERSFLWAVTRDSLASFTLPRQAQITPLAQQVYDLLTARSRTVRGETPPQRQARITRADAQLPETARQLSELLLGPVAAQLGNKRLVIVADGALQYLPFRALPEPEGETERQRDKEMEKERAKGKGEKTEAREAGDATHVAPLMINHEIISLPSASTLAVQRHELAARTPAPKLLAVIADPVFSVSDARLKHTAPAPRRSATQERAVSQAAIDAARSIEHTTEDSLLAARRPVIPRLPFTRREAEQITATAGSDSFKALDFKANRATATSPALSQYRYVHFATHGLLDAERPELSALVLSLVDEKGRRQDGFLRAHEIYNLNLPAELVVLSACETGLGKQIKGEGLVGLTRGFMYAGAARVVVSLWNVNDRATAELMTKFYQKMLQEGQRPAAALRAAQVEMWRQQQWQAPYYWAAFVLQGEWR